MIAVYVIFGIIGLVVLWAVMAYNGLVRLRNRVQNAWSQIDVQLKRRHDLIPNLVETAKGYMRHERETLESVTRARNLAAGAASGADIGKRAEVESELSSALGRFFLVVENYPDLKANQNFLALQEELTSTENKIAFSRQYYNDEVMRFNTRLQIFPTNVVAGAMGFTSREFFELKDAAEREVPKVEF